jgi:N-ethylmaleimide reductase
MFRGEHQMTTLFSPLQLGDIQLPQRVIMAPLTRSRAGQPGNVPTKSNVEYYRQRASAGLIITEATQITQQGQGYAWTPGIHSQEQIEGWAKVADAVHKEGGRIFMQLWHVGRVSHPCFQPNGERQVAPSEMEVPGQTFILDADGNGLWADVPLPRALTTDEIHAITEDYVQAAKNALAAGMDGVEIHAGNGYLLDSFINSNSNFRTDNYGGTSANRARFLLEVVKAVSDAVGSGRVGVRMTPQGRFMGMGDETPNQTFGYIAEQLNQFSIAYLHLVEPRMINFEKDESFDYGEEDIIELMRSKFNGHLILAGGYDLALANKALANKRGDAVAFGRAFIANPDLPLRYREGHALNEPDYDRFYGGDEKGYTDYPALPATV